MKKTPLVMRLIFSFTNLTYYLIVLAIIIDSLIKFGLLLGIGGDVTSFKLGIPYEAVSKEIGEVIILGSELKVTFVNAVGKLRFVEASPAMIRYHTIFDLLLTLVGFWAIHLFYRFIENVRMDKIFDAENLYLLRKLSYVIMGIWLFGVVFKLLLVYVFIGELNFESFSFYISDDYGLARLLLGLFIWILSTVFLRGLELQEENELTI